MTSQIEIITVFTSFRYIQHLLEVIIFVSHTNFVIISYSCCGFQLDYVRKQNSQVFLKCRCCVLFVYKITRKTDRKEFVPGLGVSLFLSHADTHTPGSYNRKVKILHCGKSMLHQLEEVDLLVSYGVPLNARLRVSFRAQKKTTASVGLRSKGK